MSTWPTQRTERFVRGFSRKTDGAIDLCRPSNFAVFVSLGEWFILFPVGPSSLFVTWNSLPELVANCTISRRLQEPVRQPLSKRL